MPLRLRRLLVVGVVVVTLGLAALIVIAIHNGPLGLACPSISRSTAIRSGLGKAGGNTASAKLMTLREFQAGDPAIGGGPIAPDTLVWVVVYARSGGGPSPTSPLAWVVVATPANGGSFRLQESSTVGSWPPYFNQLPDRAWFCPG